MIDEVVAFEITAEGPDPLQNVSTLRANLARLHIPATVYYAPFEHVVLLGRDWENQAYAQRDVITLYNLDFCDTIGSAVPTTDQSKKVLRFEAIRQVLLDQARVHREGSEPSWFLMLLTVRNQIAAAKLDELLGDDVLAETAVYRLACEAERALPSPTTQGMTIGKKHTWALKAALHNTLRGYFKGTNVAALYFPLVKYTGASSASPMLHWMIFCQFDDPQRPNPRFYPARFLNGVTSLRARKEDGITPEAEPGEVGPSPCTSPVEWFQRHEHAFNLTPTGSARHPSSTRSPRS